MSALHIYNTLSRKKELFEPINPPLVGLYVCGPTLYSEAHVGNLRTAISFDVVRRYLEVLGYKVRYVRNITDVGHLEDDSDAGEDKVEKQAKLERLEPMEIVEKYKQSFHHILRLFNLLPPSIEPIASGHIPEQIEMVEKIIENGFAYVAEGNVFFDVRKYNEKFGYGVLSGRKIDELYNETRELDGQAEKRDALDFALWKKVPEEHIMKWKSPWSSCGCPGWHIECSAMSSKYLGDTFDIHGGGMDLKFPHHEAEIAQSMGANQKSPVKYWMHANMLTFNGVKMSKSKGNSILPAELISGNHPLLTKGFNPMVIRFFALQSHYASELDFSNEALIAAEKGFARLSEAFSKIDRLVPHGANDELLAQLNQIEENCRNHMNDDFNTAKTIAELFELAGWINKVHDGQVKIDEAGIQRMKLIYVTFFENALGLMLEKKSNDLATKGLMEFILNMRKEARDKKDWATSDKIRDMLQALQISIKDGKDGTEYTIN
jgi:cysteinyl-tRNA synthetase